MTDPSLDPEPPQPPAATDPVDTGVALAILDAAPDCMMLVAPDGRILIANQAASDLFDLTIDELCTRSVDDLLPESLRAAHAQHRSTYGRHPRRREMGSGLELVGVRADGSEVPVEIALSPLKIDGVVHVIATVRDVTRRRADEAELARARQHLATTMERERIGRDLHDTVLQRLYGAGLGLQAALATDDETLRRRAERASNEIDDTISEIRSVIFDLNRVSVAAGDLEEQVTHVVTETAETYGFAATTRVLGYPDTDLDAAQADALLAVLHETLSNVGRHAAASTVSVDVEVDVDGELAVRVSDDGRGFDVEGVERGSGLDNLEARATAFGGGVSVTSTLGEGTIVLWRVPLVPDR